MNKSDVSAILKEGVSLISFKKVDGTVRTMEATLDDAIIPPASKKDVLSQEKVRKVNEEVQVVWDADKSAWRSFRWDNLLTVNGVDFAN